MDEKTLLDWLGVSGLVAGVGAVLGLGRTFQKLDGHAIELETLKKDVPTLIRLDERVRSMQDDLHEIKQALNAKPR
jgi:hypothetical protein